MKCKETCIGIFLRSIGFLGNTKIEFFICIKFVQRLLKQSLKDKVLYFSINYKTEN